MDDKDLIEWQREVIGAYRERMTEMIQLLTSLTAGSKYEAETQKYCNSIRNMMAVESGAREKL